MLHAWAQRLRRLAGLRAPGRFFWLTALNQRCNSIILKNTQLWLRNGPQSTRLLTKSLHKSLVVCYLYISGVHKIHICTEFSFQKHLTFMKQIIYAQCSDQTNNKKKLRVNLRTATNQGYRLICSSLLHGVLHSTYSWKYIFDMTFLDTLCTRAWTPDRTNIHQTKNWEPHHRTL